MSIRIESDIQWEIDLSIIGPNSRSVFANRDVLNLLDIQVDFVT